MGGSNSASLLWEDGRFRGGRQTYALAVAGLVEKLAAALRLLQLDIGARWHSNWLLKLSELLEATGRWADAEAACRRAMAFLGRSAGGRIRAP